VAVSRTLCLLTLRIISLACSLRIFQIQGGGIRSPPQCGNRKSWKILYCCSAPKPCCLKAQFLVKLEKQRLASPGQPSLHTICQPTSHHSPFFGPPVALLNRAGRRREHGVRVRPDQTNRTNHYYQDHSQHHGVFRDVLALIVCPESKNQICHGNLSKSIIFSGGWGFDAGGEPDELGRIAEPQLVRCLRHKPHLFVVLLIKPDAPHLLCYPAIADDRGCGRQSTCVEAKSECSADVRSGEAKYHGGAAISGC